MDALTIIALVLIVILVVGWIFYNWYTQRIIDDLVADNTALQISLKAVKREVVQLNEELKHEREIKGDAFKPVKASADIILINGLDFPNGTVQAQPKEDKDRCY